MWIINDIDVNNIDHKIDNLRVYVFFTNWLATTVSSSALENPPETNETQQLLRDTNCIAAYIFMIICLIYVYEILNR